MLSCADTGYGFVSYPADLAELAELLHYGHLIVVDRPESGGEPDIDRALNELEQRHRAESIDHAPAGRIVFNVTDEAISASQIRRRRIAGECNKDLLDPRVWSYINQHQLYQTQEDNLKPSELRDHIVAALEDLKGVNILALDVAALTPMTDYMILVTGTSNRHVKAWSIPPMSRQKPLADNRWALRKSYDWVLVDLAM